MKNDSLTAEAIILALDFAVFLAFWLWAGQEWWVAAIASTVLVQGFWWLTKYDYKKK